MPGNGLNVTRLWVFPKRMLFALAAQHAAVGGEGGVEALRASSNNHGFLPGVRG